jgi:hypothetical protein
VSRWTPSPRSRPATTPPFAATRASFAFEAAGGRTYRIAVDGWTSTFGRWQVGYADLALRSACTETLTGPLFSIVKASSGVVCIHDAVVEGAIRVGPGAQLWLIDSQVIGRLTADRAGRVVMCGTSVNGPVRLVGGTSVSLGTRFSPAHRTSSTAR